MALLVLLILSSTNSIAKTIESDTGIVDIKLINETLMLKAPTSIYVVFSLMDDLKTTGWVLVNDLFLNDIDLKLEHCKARKEFVEPLKDEAIENKSDFTFYVAVIGIPVSFSVGVFAAILLIK